MSHIKDLGRRLIADMDAETKGEPAFTTPLARPAGAVWDAATGKVHQTLKGHRGAVESVSPDGKLIASGSRDDQ
ncbi:hypothetical protein BKA56DRAFT_584039 [Ilyonectria sp. MPI-CAGE-AT-0026]|nr:hypothetical protein BKA56DRAFT_584039 [Ilyonectria sp. MPI-CAGE-AT-0026]